MSGELGVRSRELADSTIVPLISFGTVGDRLEPSSACLIGFIKVITKAEQAVVDDGLSNLLHKIN